MRGALYVLSIFVLGFLLGRLTPQTRPRKVVGVSVVDRIGTRQAASIPTEAFVASGTPNEFTAIYGRLGLRGGDTIFQINDSPAPQGFMSLRAAFQAGDVCVRYERDGQRRQVCFKRDEAGERVSDTAFSG